MNILIIGSGGREHAITWKVARSPKAAKIYALPGNPGIAAFAENVGSISLDDHMAVATFCIDRAIDLVIIGPEAPLADGLADALKAAGIRCFGPSRAAARIESSKAFSKDFMARHGIPTARFATFTEPGPALAHLESLDYPVVIKASGLAAGKGVILPDTLEDARQTLHAIMENQVFGDAGKEVVIEERLSGPEVSLMAFTDGRTVIPMIPAQDHKRLLDGDRGPNTGGMGTYAPAPVLTQDLLTEAIETVLKPAVEGLRQDGSPFVGVLYAGLMLTETGIQVLEFNCRFGDPETQVVLPLLESDLVEIAAACADGNLADVDIRWKDGAAVCVVLASEGYPEKPHKGRSVFLEELPETLFCFHAGTIEKESRILTAGGRVFGLTAWAQNIESAVRDVYANIHRIRFDGMQYRKDIAQRAIRRSAYAESGVSIDAGNRAVTLMKSAVQATYNEAVLAGIGAFGGLFDAAGLKAFDHPVLVASTDGVGTKVKLAAAAGRFRGIGHDIVNHCINDILVQGARPLFFLDYFAASQLVPEQTAEVVAGIAEACRAAGMALLGGETAEMPGVYVQGAFDVAGTIVGVLEHSRMLPRTSDLRAGDVLLGLASSGPHTNGYSLLRKLFSGIPLETEFSPPGNTLADVLLAPHRSYLPLLHHLLPQLKALVHVTGGGFIENVPRVLPGHLDAWIRPGSWPTSPLWEMVQRKGNIETAEMFRVFNMGIGMIAVIDRATVNDVRQLIPEETYLIGELIDGTGKTILEGSVS